MYLLLPKQTEQLMTMDQVLKTWSIVVSWQRLTWLVATAMEKDGQPLLPKHKLAEMDKYNVH